ncbi:MAG: hypothetical protein HZB99_00425 [Candidatus Harrisonbacteria bacterium]|nr:hypothetical protein [Candidatus Harrisonbacteria bacterium]
MEKEATSKALYGFIPSGAFSFSKYGEFWGGVNKIASYRVIIFLCGC